MSNESTLHRWALLDKAGKVRDTSTAKTKSNARFAFTEARGGKAIPKGWTIVDRGPVDESVQRAADAFHEAIEKAKPEPGTFQVGDTIRLLAKHWAVSEGSCPPGTTAKLKRKDGGDCFWCSPIPGYRYGFAFSPCPQYIGAVEKVEPAPQPKAEENGVPVHLLSGMVDRFLGWKLPEDFGPDGGISFDPNRLGPPRLGPTGTNLLTAIQAKAMLEHVAGPAVAECQGAVDSINGTLIKHQGLLYDARQEIASLQSEVTSLKAEVERLSKSLHEEMALGAGIESARLVLLRKAMDAEAKLADIKAIIRTFKILNDLPGEPGFTDAVNAVLDGAA